MNAEEIPADEQLVLSIASLAKASASAFQNALQFATQTEQALATSVDSLAELGLSVDDIAFRVGLRREYVEELREGGRITHRFF